MSVPALDEAARVVDFILHREMKAITDRIGDGTPAVDSTRDLLALTIAVVGATEHYYTALGRSHPTQWESMERWAATFIDRFVVRKAADSAPQLKRAIARQRRRKLAARAGRLRLVEPDRNRRSRWAAVILPPDAPVPIAEEVADGLREPMIQAEERLYKHLAAVPSNALFVLAGQVVALLVMCELLLAQIPSKEIAAFCIQVGTASAARQWDERRA